MQNFNEDLVVRGRFFTLWVDGEEMGEVKTADTTSELSGEKVPIAGRLGEGERITGSTGTGSLVFWKCYNGLNKKINDCIKNHKPFKFDLTGQSNDTELDGYERVTIQNCIMKKFKPLQGDITKTLLEESYDFSYNVENVDFE